MTLKLLQLNLFQGKFLNNVIDFIKKEDIDIVTLQEVTGGKYSRGGLNYYPGRIDYHPKKINEENLGMDCFESLKKKLNYTGICAVNYHLTTDPASYSANASFFSSKINVNQHQIIWMKNYRECELEEDPSILPRSALAVKCKVVNIVFKNPKNGKYIVIGLLAKKARGMFADFVVRNNIQKIEDLKKFDRSGYVFDAKSSNDFELVFLRK